MFRFLEILSMNHEIVFLAQGRTGERPEEEGRYLDSLKDLNIKTYVEEYSLAKILMASTFRAAILEFYYVADHYIPRIRILQPKCHVIVDTVDLHYRRAFSKYQMTGRPEDLSAAEKTKREELDTYRKADGIVTVTDEDAEVLYADCPGLRVWTIPNIHEAATARGRDGNRNLLFVGGFRHEPNVDAILYFYGEVFPRIRLAIPDCTFTIVGSDPPEEILELQSESIHVTGFVPRLDPFFRSSYISVAPLRFGAGMKGKVGEAMAEGLPVVTTSIGAQGMGLVHRHDAMICDSPSEFADSVVELFRDPGLYEIIRKNALEKIDGICGKAYVGKRVDEIMGQLDDRRPHRLGFKEKMNIASNFLKKMFP